MEFSISCVSGISNCIPFKSTFTTWSPTTNLLRTKWNLFTLIITLFPWWRMQIFETFQPASWCITSPKVSLLWNIDSNLKLIDSVCQEPPSLISWRKGNDVWIYLSFSTSFWYDNHWKARIWAMLVDKSPSIHYICFM